MYNVCFSCCLIEDNTLNLVLNYIFMKTKFKTCDHNIEFFYEFSRNLSHDKRVIIILLS